MTPKLRILLGALLIAIPADQASKIWIESHLSYADRIPVIEGFFYLTHVRNPGAAFSLFTTLDPTLRMTFFVSISLVATGNLIDRLWHGEVVDFLHFRLWSGYSWPDFNLADSFIVVGVGLLVLELVASEGESRATSASNSPS